VIGVGALILTAGPPPDFGEDLGGLLKLGIVLAITIAGAVLAKRKEQQAKHPPPLRTTPRKTEVPPAASGGPPVARPTPPRQTIPEMGTLREDVDNVLERLRQRAQGPRGHAKLESSFAPRAVPATPPPTAPAPVVQRVGETAIAQRIGVLLGNPTDLRAAFVLAEILAPPLALRE
jgi:hypothetical protein